MCVNKARLRGKVAVVTGGNSGMGLEAAKDLASRGARVIISGRNATKLQAAKEDIIASTGNQDIDYRLFDLESTRSIRNFAQEINQEPSLDILLNNAGGIGMPDRLTGDGLNLMMQVNFFGPFLLTFLLFPKLRASAPSRVVISSAITMHFGNIDFDHWNDLKRYTVLEQSGNAKLAAALISAEWSRRVKNTGVTVNSFDPFLVKDTDISRHIAKTYQDSANRILEVIGRSKEEVGMQMAYYASSPDLEGVTGQHFKFCIRWPRPWQADNKALGRRLWREAKRLTNITRDEDWELRQKREISPQLSIVEAF